MNITYLDHSGFAVVTEDVVLVFDYYRDPSNSLKKILNENTGKPVVFFVSHRHRDHYNDEIFNMAHDHRRVYVMSNDIKASRISDNVPIAWMSPGDTLTDLPGNITVKTYGSTDEGVSYLVTTNDRRTLFHAGDFNYWHWQDESTEKEVRIAYDKFVKVMNSIMRDVKSIDVAFFPVDPRLGTDFAQGARLFMENINVEYFFPMHFTGDTKSACSFEDYTTDNTIPVCLNNPGQSYVVPETVDSFK